MCNWRTNATLLFLFPLLYPKEKMAIGRVICRGVLSKIQIEIYVHCTEVRFASFSGEFTTMTVINPPERKMRKRTSVHWRPCLKGMFLQLMKEETSKLFSCEYTNTCRDSNLGNSPDSCHYGFYHSRFFFQDFPRLQDWHFFSRSYPQCRFFHGSPNCRMILCLTFHDFPMM